MLIRLFEQINNLFVHSKKHFSHVHSGAPYYIGNNVLYFTAALLCARLYTVSAARHRKVLPPGELNSMIPLPAYTERFMATAVMLTLK